MMAHNHLSLLERREHNALASSRIKLASQVYPTFAEDLYVPYPVVVYVGAIF